MNEWLTMCAIALSPLLSAPAIPLYREPFNARLTWMGLSERDLIARTILAEAGARVLDPRTQADAFGVGWVIWNRSRHADPFEFGYGRNDVYEIVVAPNQFLAMRSEGNAARAADPDAYWRWYGADAEAGRRAYWTAFRMADCITHGAVSDPTGGALFFSDHRYTHDAGGEINGIENYPDGRTRFRRRFGETSWLAETPQLPQRNEPTKPNHLEME